MSNSPGHDFKLSLVLLIRHPSSDSDPTNDIIQDFFVGIYKNQQKADKVIPGVVILEEEDAPLVTQFIRNNFPRVRKVQNLIENLSNINFRYISIDEFIEKVQNGIS